jgi:hypothetical protein
MRIFASKYQYLLCTLLLILSVSKNTYAQAYKCAIDGKVTFSQTPCKNASSEMIELKASPVSDIEYQRAIKRNKRDAAELKKIETAREKEFIQNQKRANKLAAKNKKDKQRCDDYQLKVKWAREDLADAKPKTEIKARTKLRRAEEKAALACGR